VTDDGARRVEFIEDDAGDDTDSGPTQPRSPAVLRRLLIAALVIVVGAVLIGRAATSHKDNRPLAGPTPPAPSPSIASSAADAVGVDSCPKASYCRSSPQVPAAAAAALRQYLPAFGALTVTTVTRKDAASDPAGLWSRLIETHSAAIDLLILIRGTDMPQPKPTIALTPTPPGLASAFLRTNAAGYEVDVQWTAPDTQPPPITALTALSKDDRLEALG
jgi:hypothetical protein